MGVVLADQVKSLDWRLRRAELIWVQFLLSPSLQNQQVTQAVSLISL
jgi:hypothetical protein